MNLYSLLDLKTKILGLTVSAALLSGSFWGAYRLYLSQMSEAAYEAANSKNAKLAYTSCKTYHATPSLVPNQPKELCLNFFLKTVPSAFNMWGPKEFPFHFTNPEHFIHVYSSVQEDLEAWGMQTLPSLHELTHGTLTSSN
jgi:hypothetical protein